MSNLFTLTEAADLLGVSLSSVRRYVYIEDILPSIKVFGGRRVTAEQLQQYRALRVACPRWTRKRRNV
jgi:DNA-binding transcriptional MerR regulator